MPNKETDWNTKKLLDHGIVSLVDAMPHWDHNRSATGLEPADARVVEAARVSMGVAPNDEIRLREQDEKLIDYLMKNAHTSPFEKVRFEFIVKLPIFIARQWIRHRTGSFNEISARYSKLPGEFYVPAPERMQAQSKSNKQASGEALPELMTQRMLSCIEVNSTDAYFAYETLLENGLARELARMVLPTNFYTQWCWTVDLHNLMGFLKLRLHSHAQYEIRVYAEAMLEMITEIAPISVAAFKKHVMEEK